MQSAIVSLDRCLNGTLLLEAVKLGYEVQRSSVREYSGAKKYIPDEENHATPDPRGQLLGDTHRLVVIGTFHLLLTLRHDGRVEADNHHSQKEDNSRRGFVSISWGQLRRKRHSSCGIFQGL